MNKLKIFFIKLLKKLNIFNDVYYINGSDVLPAPLEKDEEDNIMAMLSDESKRDQARQLLVVHNLRLVVYISKKFESTGIGTEDLISIGTIGLIKAVNTFCPEKNIKLATYASRCIENEILMYIRKTVNSKNDISIDEPLNIDWDGNELLLSDVLGSDPNSVNQNIEQLAEKNMLLCAVERLPEREKVIMQMRFGLIDGVERTQKEVADLIGISQSYISRLEKRIIKQLRRELEKSFIS